MNEQLISKFNFTNNEIKAVNTLYGLIMGFTADNHLSDQEIYFLDIWLKEHSAYCHAFPLNILRDRINAVLEDNIITEDERQHLHATMNSLLGGTFEETGSAGGMATDLPTDAVDSIDFNARSFCFTGEFIFGTRNKCEQAIIELGGIPAKSITTKLNYLVIGSLSSANWIAAGHGRKIEKVQHYKQKGVHIFVLSEEQWVKFLHDKTNNCSHE